MFPSVPKTSAAITPTHIHATHIQPDEGWRRSDVFIWLLKLNL